MANAIGDLIDKVQEYVELKTEQVKLIVLEKTAKLLSGVISFSIIILLSFFLLFFLSFALANMLNEMLDSTYAGFFILCGFYTLIMIIIGILARKGIIQGWFESLILKLAEKDNEEID